MRKTAAKKSAKTGLGERLPEELDLMAAEALKAHLNETIATGVAPVLDASRVERITTPCIQVLLAAGRAAEKQKMPFEIQNPSEALTAAFANLGLDAELNRWS